MSRTLNFTTCLLDKARKLHELGLDKQAASLLERLVRLPDLSAAHAEEIHSRLADIRLREEEHRQARRHLAVAMLHAPNNARYHYQMAGALLDDPRGNAARAERCFRKAIRLDPKNAEYLADYGILAMQNGDRAGGLAALQRACDFAANDANLIGCIIDALVGLDEIDEAQRLLRRAQFRNSHDRRFRSLWNELQFHMLSAAQETCEQPATTAPTEARNSPLLATVLPRHAASEQRRPYSSPG